MYMRDMRKPLELPDDKLQKLVTDLEAITGTKFNSAFADQVNNFIGILREKSLVEQNAPKNKQIKRELVKFKNAMSKAYDIESGQLSFNAQMLLFSAIEGSLGTYTESIEHLKILIQACTTAIEGLPKQDKSKELSFAVVKQAMATELARELNSFGIKITSYRDGIFGKCVREFFNAFNGQAIGITFNIYVAEDLFQTIKTAKKDYLKTERFVLLKFR